MPAYSQQELDRARQPIRDAADRDGAVCVLGHLMTEQREAHTEERAGIITGITAAVQDFDTRSALGAPAQAFGGTGGAQPLAAAPPAVPVPGVIRPPAPVDTTATAIAATRASMDRELRRQGLISADRQPHDARSASGPVGLSSMQRELLRAGLIRG